MVNSKKEGRAATGIPGTSRSRLQKIAAIPKAELKAIATKIQDSGGDATVTAVAKCGDLKALAAAGEKFAVIYADPPSPPGGPSVTRAPTGLRKAAISAISK